HEDFSPCSEFTQCRNQELRPQKRRVIAGRYDAIPFGRTLDEVGDGTHVPANVGCRSHSCRLETWLRKRPRMPAIRVCSFGTGAHYVIRDQSWRSPRLGYEAPGLHDRPFTPARWW